MMACLSHSMVRLATQEDEQAEARPASAFRTGRIVLEAERRRKGLPPVPAGDEAAKGGRQPGDTDRRSLLVGMEFHQLTA